MLSETKIAHLNAEIRKLVDLGQETEALALVREEPLIFCELPADLKDSESFAFTAMSRLFQAGSYASSRLKRNINFFIKAFNAYSFIDPITLATVHDTIFMLEYAKSYCYYRHEIGEDSVVNQFSCVPPEATDEINSANSLISLVNNCASWLTNDKEKSIELLAAQAPGFQQFSYIYAFTWAYGERSMREAYEYL